MTDFIGILPAAGRGARLWPNRYPKELLPMAFVSTEDGVRPVPTASYSIAAMGRAGVGHVLVVIADWKLELVRVLGNGDDLGVSIAYLHQEEPKGLGHAVNSAGPWVRDRNVCLGLPDTVYRPREAFVPVCQAVRDGADLVLGVFPVENPEELGPVEVEAGRVVRVLDKPQVSPVQNTWGIAAWSPVFTALLDAYIQEHPSHAIGHAFQAAVERGLRVEAVVFEDGHYADTGTTRRLSDLMLEDLGVPGTEG